MTEIIAIDLGNVQKTLFLPLWGRAFETKKEHPLLVDKMAVEILDKVDYDFSTIAANMSPLSQLAWILRSKFVDETIETFLQKFPTGTIVNIGCGLDTTFERVDNGTLRWYDLDLPDVIDLRRKFVSESERRTYIASSFLEPGWLKQIKVSGNVLFVAAGVFYYFTGQEIRDFFTLMANTFPGSELVCDVCSPYGVKIANKMVIQRGGMDEKSFLTWGLEKVADIPSWDPRFKIMDTYFYFRGNGKYLSLTNRLFGMLSDYKKIQYIVHLKLGGLV